MNAKENVQSRKHYRITYPVDRSPVLEIGTHSYPVLDLSELGVRVAWQAGVEPRELQEIEGSILFQNNSIVHIKGRIVRIQNETVAMELSEGVPMSIIMAEQRYLLKAFHSQES